MVHHLVPNFVREFSGQFKDNVSQCKIAKNFCFSPSAIHNIVKRFSESGEISVCKRQGRKPRLNARDHQALRWYCLRNLCYHDGHSHMGSGLLWKITQQSLPLHQNLAWNGFMRRKAFINFVQKRR